MKTASLNWWLLNSMNGNGRVPPPFFLWLLYFFLTFLRASQNNGSWKFLPCAKLLDFITTRTQGGSVLCMTEFLYEYRESQQQGTHTFFSSGRHKRSVQDISALLVRLWNKKVWKIRGGGAGKDALLVSQNLQGERRHLILIVPASWPIHQGCH